MQQFYTSQEKADRYDAVINVFDALFREVKELGKKKPEATLGEGKVKMINRVLEDAKKCLEGEPDDKYLDLLDFDDAPQYGDAILVLSQYEGALVGFRARSYGYDSETGHGWFIKTGKKAK